MVTLLVLIIGVIVIAAFLAWNRRPIRRTKQEVIALMQAWQADQLSVGEWDYFESCEIHDQALESVRKRCAELSLSADYTEDPKMSHQLNNAGKSEVAKILAEMRDGQ